MALKSMQIIHVHDAEELQCHMIVTVIEMRIKAYSVSFWQSIGIPFCHI